MNARRCGIFAYASFLCERVSDAEKLAREGPARRVWLLLTRHAQDRRFVLETLINGLQRMEYRGYDSAGLSIEGDEPDQPFIFKEVGKVAHLKEKCMTAAIDMDRSYVSQTSIAHTRSVASLIPKSVIRRHVSLTERSVPLQLGHPRCSVECAETSENTQNIVELTPGTPAATNCHPHTSDPMKEFTVVHNGIITNCALSVGST